MPQEIKCPACGSDSIGSGLDVTFDVWYNQETGRWHADLDTMRDMIDDIAAEVTERANGVDRPAHLECGECGHDWEVD